MRPIASTSVRGGDLLAAAALLAAVVMTGSAVTSAAAAAPSAGPARVPSGDAAYDGEWLEAKSLGSVPSHRYSTERGSTYTLRFTGTRLSLFGAVAPHHGMASVRIDDGAAAVVDQYAEQRQDDVLVFRSDDLTQGEHVAVIEVLGQRRPGSSGDAVAIQRVVVDQEVGEGDSDGATSRSTVSVNDSTSSPRTDVGSFSFSGSWREETGARGRFEGDEHHSSRPGSSYTVRFRGVGLSLHGALAPHHGKAAVQIDGGDVTVVDQYGHQRQDDALLYRSTALSDGEHVAVVTVLDERNPRSSGHVVAVDRAVVAVSPAAPAPSRPGSDGDEVWRDDGDGSDLRSYASTSSNGSHPLWHVESTSSAISRVDGVLRKSSDAQFHRMFSTRRFGGPGTSLLISYRARATAIRDRRGSSIVQGAKIGLKWPVASSITGFSKDDPQSVYGQPSQDEHRSPGSYAFLTGLTERGYLELARNGYGAKGYEFFDNESVGYTPGTWKDISVSVEWLADRGIRVRYWHNATASGEPLYEATDRQSPFWEEPAFLWLRTDDTDWEYDHIVVRQCQGPCLAPRAGAS